ncbi:unnamed protein product, partial [Discosporangium mesarthrocarpum]
GEQEERHSRTVGEEETKKINGKAEKNNGTGETTKAETAKAETATTVGRVGPAAPLSGPAMQLPPENPSRGDGNLGSSNLLLSSASEALIPLEGVLAGTGSGPSPEATISRSSVMAEVGGGGGHEVLVSVVGASNAS